MDKQLDQDLHCWAAYHRAYNTTGLGYDAMSITARCAEVLKLGTVINGSYKPKELTTPEWIEKVDYAITMIKPVYQEIIKKHYMGKGSTDRKCRELDIEKDNYYKRLERARELINQELQALDTLSEMSYK